MSVLLFFMLLGVVVAQSGRAPQGLAKQLNWWALYIATPATVLEIVPRLQFTSSLWFLAASQWFIFILAWVLFHWLAKIFGWSRNTLGAIILTAGLGNTAFVGFPLIEALRGKEALAYAAIADQIGAFLAINIGGSVVVALYAGCQTSTRQVVRRVLLFPPFVALIIALGVSFTSGWPVLVDDLLNRLSATMAPLVLFSVGLQLQLQALKHHTAPLLTGLTWKLGLAPLLVLCCGRFLHIDSSVLTISVLESAMAPMISAAILAEQHELNPPLANMMVGIGILLSFITVPLWNALL